MTPLSSFFFGDMVGDVFDVAPRVRLETSSLVLLRVAEETAAEIAATFAVVITSLLPLGSETGERDW